MKCRVECEGMNGRHNADCLQLERDCLLSEVKRLRESKKELLAFIKTIADAGCWENPGEFPEDGESGNAPCLACQARAAIANAEREGRGA